MPLFPKMKYAFCGCSLEVGAKIVAILHLAIYTVVFLTYFVYMLLPYNHHHSSNSTEFNITENSTEYSDEEESEQSIGWDMKIDIHNIRATYFMDFAVLVQLCFACYLYYGIQQKSTQYLFSWILLQVSYFIHSLLIILLNMFVAFSYFPQFIIAFIVEELAIIGFELYMVNIVYNYYSELEELSAQQAEEL